jgi:hypothetical protein
MNKPYSLDGVQTILAYPFKAPGWQSKFVIGAALFFANYIIPILPGIFMAGYFSNIMRAVIVDDAEPSLPEWEDWGKLFSRGLKVFCAATIYLLPAIVLMIGGYIIMEAPIFMMGFSGDRHPGSANPMLGILLAGVFIGMAMFFLGLILYMPLSLMLPPAIAHLVAKDSFAAAFRIREWFAILRANFWGFFTAASVVSGVYLILFMIVYALYLTIILCFLFPVALSVIVMYLSVVSAPLLGEAYRKGAENLAAAASV